MYGMVKVPPLAARPPSSCSPPVPPQGAPCGSGQLGAPRVGPSHWAPSHRLGGSREPPPKSPMSLPLTIQAECVASLGPDEPAAAAAKEGAASAEEAAEEAEVAGEKE